MDESPTAVTQLPVGDWKQPAESLIPTFDVVVALPEMLRPLTVVVPKPEPETVRSVVEALLTMLRMRPSVFPQMVVVAYEVVVPIATLPEKLAAAAVSVPVSVGEAERTKFPVPVSSESHCASCAEVEKSEEVAMSW
jgi:hypothetical protein